MVVSSNIITNGMNHLCMKHTDITRRKQKEHQKVITYPSLGTRTVFTSKAFAEKLLFAQNQTDLMMNAYYKTNESVLSRTVHEELTHVNHLLLQHWSCARHTVGANRQPWHRGTHRGSGKGRAELRSCSQHRSRICRVQSVHLRVWQTPVS